MTSTSDRPTAEAIPVFTPRVCALGFAVWSVVALALSLVGNTDRRPLDEHEVYVARTAVEMSRRGDWIVPYFGGTPRLQKLPLNYWLTIGAAQLLGEKPSENVSAFAARFPSALAGFLLMLLTAALTWQITRSPGTALLAAAAVATSNGVVSWSHNARPEMVYATLCTAGLLCFVLVAERMERSGRQIGWREIACSLLGWTFLALATLAKGPHYPLFIVLSITIAVWHRWRSIHQVRSLLRPGIGIVIAAAIVLAYVVPLNARVPNLFEFWYREMFYRTGGAEGILHLFRFYYVWALVQLAAPWSLVVFLAVVWAARRLRKVPPGASICWFALVVPALILSCSRGQRAYYLLPSLGAAFGVAAYAVHSVVLSGRWLMGRPLPVDRLIRLHVVLAAVLAGAVLFRAWQFVQIGIVTPAEMIAVTVGLISGAVALAIAYARAAAPQPVGALSGLFAGTAAVLVVGTACGLLWSPDRYTEVAEVKRFADELPEGVPTYALSGRIEHLIYYGDRPVRRITHTEAAQMIDNGSHALLILSGDCPRCRELARRLSKTTAVKVGDDQLLLAQVGSTPTARTSVAGGGEPERQLK